MRRWSEKGVKRYFEKEKLGVTIIMSKSHDQTNLEIQLVNSAEELGLTLKDLKNIFEAVDTEATSSKLSEEEIYLIFKAIYNAFLNLRVTKKEIEYQLGKNFTIGKKIAHKVLQRYYE